MTKPTKMSDEGLKVTTTSEGCKLTAYPDPGTGAEPWTIGYGHTKGVMPGMTCTQEQAIAWLKQDVSWAEQAVSQLVTVPLTQGQFDALVDFVFNTGTTNFRKSTLLQKLNAGHYEEVDSELLKWVFAGGRKLPGLQARREKEASEFDDSAPDVA